MFRPGLQHRRRLRRFARLTLLAGTVLATSAVATLAAPAAHAQPGADGSDHGGDASKPRVILMHDPELDDQNTLIRYLLYSNEFETEGLVYTSGRFHWAGDGKGTEWNREGRQYTEYCPCTSWRWEHGGRFIHDAVDIYAEVYPNLKQHAEGYPTPDELRSVIYTGNIQFDGDISQDSPGSDLIKEKLLDDEPGPLYLLTGAGQSTIARALLSIELEYGGTPQWPEIYRKVSQKAIIQSFGDQDDTYAKYIKPNWPDIRFREMATATWGYGAREVVLPKYAKYLSAEWTRENVSEVGPFGEFYRVWGDGKQMVPGDIFDYFGHSGLTEAQLEEMGYVVWMPPQEPGSWISEGDTSIFMNLLDNGLRASENPTWGGWGGREGTDKNPTGATSEDYATARWFGPAQRDFAARMRWTVTPEYAGANHAPTVEVQGPLNLSAAPGTTVRIDAEASDPDGNVLTGNWWQYTDVDTYPGNVTLETTGKGNHHYPVTFTVPDDAVPGQTIHLILQVTDDGAPAMTSYRRVVVTVS